MKRSKKKKAKKSSNTPLSVGQTIAARYFAKSEGFDYRRGCEQAMLASDIDLAIMQAVTRFSGVRTSAGSPPGFKTIEEINRAFFPSKTKKPPKEWTGLVEGMWNGKKGAKKR